MRIQGDNRRLPKKTVTINGDVENFSSSIIISEKTEGHGGSENTRDV